MEALQKITTPFESEQFGDLVKLPDAVKQWKVEADDLKAKAERFQSTLTATDLSKLPDADLDALDSRLTKSIQVISGAFTKIESQRKSATSILDDIKAFTMLPEKSIASYPSAFKAYRDMIAGEKAQRQRKAEAQRQAEIAKKQEAIDLRAKVAKFYNDAYLNLTNSTIQKLNNAFYSQKLEDLATYEAKLKKYNPEAQPGIEFDWSTVGTKYHNKEEAEAIVLETFQRMAHIALGSFVDAVNTERERLIELIPSRKRELEEIAKGNAAAERAAKERQEKEEADRQALLQQQQAEQAEALEATAELDKVDAAFDSEAATTVTSLPKGTVIRKKYIAKSHKAYAALLQSWVKNNMHLLTLDELGKKLSFATTSANERLNKGETLQADGLEVVDDYSTRTSRKAATS